MLYEIDHNLLERNLRKPETKEPTDEQLMSRIKQQDDLALEIMFCRHVQFLRGVTAGLISNHHDIDEVIQDTFLTVWDEAERYDEVKGKALGWLVTIARRRAIDKRRRALAYNRARERSRVATENELNSTGGTNYRPNRNLTVPEMSDILDQAMEVLPEAQRQAVHLAFYHGLSQREIAAKTGIPLGTIKTRIELGLRKLQGAVFDLEGPAMLSFASA